MHSYVGRHRRPTSRRRLATYAAVPFVSAASLTMAAPAEAASTSTWERLSGCEASENWKANTGNGYYGGLQFSLSSWRAVGGKGYPHQNSKAEQIYRAEKLLKLQGWGAWPTCSRKLGLTNADKGGSPNVSASRSSARKGAAPKRKAATKATRKSVSTKGTYVVRSGDTLSSIARRHGVDGGWKALYRANRGVVENPNAIYVGERLRLVK